MEHVLSYRSKDSLVMYFQYQNVVINLKIKIVRMAKGVDEFPLATGKPSLERVIIGILSFWISINGSTVNG